MKPLVTNRKVLTWIGILPAAERTNKFRKLIYITFYFALTSSSGFALFTSLTFMLKYMSTNLEDCLYALFQVAADMNLVYMMVIALILRRKIAALFDRLTEIYNERKKSMKLFFFLLF